MKANLPRCWGQLPQRERDIIIKEVVAKQINDGLDHEEAELQKVWLQMACMVIHDALGHDKDDCFLFLGNWKRLYRKIGKCKTNEERDEYLKAEMDKIFGDDGYPYEWVDSLEK